MHGLVAPLLTTAAGAKFGKSEDGSVWLDPARTSPYKFYQFWLNTDDRDAERLLKIFTDRPLDEIAGIAKEHGSAPHRREAQRILAADITQRVHGPEVIRGVLQASDILFGAADIRAADLMTLRTVASEVQTVPVTRAELETGYPVVEALLGTGLASSKADARRGIQGHGYSVNGEKLTAERTLGSGDLLASRFIVLQKGKKHYAMIDAG